MLSLQMIDNHLFWCQINEVKGAYAIIENCVCVSGHFLRKLTKGGVCLNLNMIA